jgi:phosphoglycerate-specific signal transduction histidine kinase
MRGLFQIKPGWCWEPVSHWKDLEKCYGFRSPFLALVHIATPKAFTEAEHSAYQLRQLAEDWQDYAAYLRAELERMSEYARGQKSLVADQTETIRRLRERLWELSQRSGVSFRTS